MCLMIYGIVNERQNDSIQTAQETLQRQHQTLDHHQRVLDKQQHELEDQSAKDRAILREVRRNSRRGVTAICVLVGFLDNSLHVQKKLLASGQVPADERAARIRSIRQTRRLSRELRTTVRSCPKEITKGPMS